MKDFALSFLMIALFACSNSEQTGELTKNDIEPNDTTEVDTPLSIQDDLAEIEQLIRDVTAWQDLGNPTHPELILDSANSRYTGLNLFELDLAAEELVSVDYFTEKFTENNSDIHRTIDEKLRSSELIYEVGTYPPYGSGASPWCNCQDVPYDEPNPWEGIEIETIELAENSGQFYWKWSNVDPNSDWGKHRYYFEVKKVDGKWKISHLEGFTREAFLGNN